MDKRNGMTRPVYKSGALLSLAVLFLSYPALAQNVGDACTGTNRQYTVSGTSNSALICNGTTLELLEKDLSNPVRKGIGTATPEATLDVFSTDSVLLPRGTTAQRPGTPVNGMIRYNSTLNKFEAYENGAWVTVISGGSGTPAGADNEIQFNDAGAFATDSRLTYEKTTGFLINNGEIVADNLQSYRFDFRGNWNTGLQNPAADSLALWAGSEKVRITPSGVGIGTTSPGALLHTNVTSTTGNTVLEALLLSHEDSNSAAANNIGAALTFNLETATNNTSREAARIAGVWDDATNNSKDGSLRFYTMGPNAASGTTTTTERLRIDSSGRLGVATSTPAAPLHVAGEAIIGNTSLSCSGTTAGGMRWNSGSGCIQFCNGTSWACISPTAGCDATPATFDFTDLNGLTASTLTSSDILSITGTDPACNAVVSVSGDGSPQFRVCSDSICSSVVQNWTATNTALDMNGRFLQIRATTDASPSTTVNVTAMVGGVSNVWQITTTSTGPCGDVGPGDEGQICSDGSVYAGVTPDGNRNMYVPRCDLGMSWDGANCTGIRSAPPWNNGNTSGDVLTGYTSYNNGSANTAGLIVLDSDSGVGGTQPHQAAQACADLNVHGKTDWYLPGYDELSVIYEKLVDGMPNDNNPDPLISGFATGDYWSSSEAISQYAWARQFTDGVGGNMAKQVASIFVRCARKD